MLDRLQIRLTLSILTETSQFPAASLVRIPLLLGIISGTASVVLPSILIWPEKSPLHTFS